MGDLSGRVVFVTGANSGIGKEAAIALARRGATTVVGCRNRGKGEAALADIRASGGSEDVHLVELDLASFASIRRAAAEMLERWPQLHVLINNAGVILTERQLTAEGFETTFGVNHLGHFLLTSLLLDRLKASAPSRIVNVASFAHRLTRDFDFDDVQRERGYSGTPVYNQSKLANVLFTRELARRLEGTGVSVFAVHPGTVRSGYGQDGDTTGLVGLGLKLIRPLLIGPKTGAASTIYAAAEPGIEPESGAYYQRVAFGNYGPVREARTSRAARDDDGARRLWELSEELIASVPP